MMRSVFLKTLYDRRFFIFGWTLGLCALAILMASFFPAMSQSGVLDSLSKQMPSGFQGLIGDLAILRTFDGYLASQLFDIRMLPIAGAMVIILGLALSTKEEEDGELRTQLALPLSRTRLFMEKWLALFVVTTIAILGIPLGIFAAIPFIDGAEISLGTLARLVVMTLLVMTAYSTVTFAAGMATGKRSLATMTGILLVVGSYFISTFSVSIDWLRSFEWLSLMNYFTATDVVKKGIDAGDVAVLAAVILVSLTVSLIVFRRRDIA